MTNLTYQLNLQHWALYWHPWPAFGIFDSPGVDDPAGEVIMWIDRHINIHENTLPDIRDLASAPPPSLLHRNSSVPIVLYNPYHS